MYSSFTIIRIRIDEGLLASTFPACQPLFCWILSVSVPAVKRVFTQLLDFGHFWKIATHPAAGIALMLKSKEFSSAVLLHSSCHRAFGTLRVEVISLNERLILYLLPLVIVMYSMGLYGITLLSNNECRNCHLVLLIPVLVMIRPILQKFH
jgi:hypothetical protein